MKGVSGSLLSLDVLRSMGGSAEERSRTARARSLLESALRAIGPTSAARRVLDALALPLLESVGLRIVAGSVGQGVVGAIQANGVSVATVAVGGWEDDLARLIRSEAGDADRGLRWSVAINGASLRIADRSRAYSRRVVDFALREAEEDEETLGVLLRLLDCGLDRRLAVLEQTVAESDRHRTAVGASLQAGVEEALVHLVNGFAPRRRALDLDWTLANALTIVFRLLFLLFAEARGLVPQWHPIYRNSYTIESLRPRIERNRRPPGIWHALQAISRLAHRGCRAGTLRVTPFNGRLFSPAAAPLAESPALDDRRIRSVLLAITTRDARDRRERISYADLGVEQLGAVYERVLDYAPAIVDRSIVLSRSGRRKATGTFYTPRTMTEYLVRRTLSPLVSGVSSQDVLKIRVVDPAMGSGAFLVAACRYLADAYERALLREGAASSDELSDAERAGFRRTIAQRCLFGVDRNPTAVQLARLSLWLATLAADRPLTFLDHHLRSGNSVCGVSPRDIMRQPPGKTRAKPRPDAPSLFDADDLARALAIVVPPRTRMGVLPDDTIDAVRSKERSLAALELHDTPLGRWKALADAWCAVWFWPSSASQRPPVWSAISATLRGLKSHIPASLEHSWLDTIRQIVSRERFFHWELEFPEVFFDSDGCPLESSGFDAVLGNPPWDTLRGYGAEEDEPSPRALTRFSRDSGCYRLQADGHANLYQLFTERALQLVRPGGRIGLLLPSGLLADHGCRLLRRELLTRTSMDGVLSFDNRDGTFPIHRGIKFLLLTGSADSAPMQVQARFGLHAPGILETIADDGPVPESVSLPLTLIRKFGGDGLAVPELRTDRDRRILANVLSAVPALASEEGWNCRFGRELNATDDRRHFGRRGLPVLEGKHLGPFHITVPDAPNRIPRAIAERLLRGRAAFDRPRLGYREVAASTNRLTLIAAIIPADIVTTHTIFSLKEAVGADVQWFLCGMFNSFVANYLVRLRGGTHVTASIIGLLPMPVPTRSAASFVRIAALARQLSASAADADAHAELQALAALLYGCDAPDFAHILDTFPLVPRATRDACAAALEGLADRLPVCVDQP